MGNVIVKTHYDVYDPLDKIPKESWRGVVLKKAHHVKQIIFTNLDDALDILNDLERHEAWDATEMTKDFFLRITCGVAPKDLPKLREGYNIMRGKGQQCPTPDLAMTAYDEAEKARFDAVTRKRGRPRKNSVLDANKKLDRGKNSKQELLRRLARDAPSHLAAFERGEYKSARAAAKAAGIPVQKMIDLMGRPTTIAARIREQGDDFVNALLKALGTST